MARTVALGLLAVAALAPLVSRWWLRDFFAPPALAAAAWGSTLGLYGLLLLPYKVLRADTLALLLTATGVMIAAGAAGVWLGRRRPPRMPAAAPAHASRWVAAYALIGLTGAAWYVTEVVSRLGWRGFLDGVNVRYLLATYQIPSTFLFLEFFCLASPLLALALRLSGVRVGRVAMALAAACVVFTLISTDRTQPFMLFLSALFMVAARRGPTQPAWRTALIGGGVLATLLAVFFAVAFWTGKTSETFGLRLQLPKAPPDTLQARVTSGVMQTGILYYYATSPYPALDTVLAAPPPPTHGLQAVYPIARLLQRLHLTGGLLPPAIPPFVDVLPPSWPPPPPTNVYTFLYYPFQDFGWHAALIYAAAVALVCGLVYGRARADAQSAAWRVAAGQCSTGLALSFFVNKFNNTAAWYILAATLLPFAVSRLRRRPETRAAAA
jgi:hypothetical protein